MPSGIQSRSSRHRGNLWLPILAAVLLPLATAQFSSAQIHGIPPSVTSIQNHFPPYLPNVPASVTSLGPFGYVGPPAFPVYPPVSGPFPGRHSSGFGYGCGFRNGCGYRKGYGYSGGAYVVPVYAPIIDASYGDDPGAPGPYMYSGPPTEQAPHIIVDMPPAKRSPVADDNEDNLPPVASKAARSSDAPSPPDATPIGPTVLVFRDGHHQEVSNYAIMGQTVFVFDGRRQKIALGDLDVPATVKANDDRGIEFQIPKAKKS